MKACKDCKHVAADLETCTHPTCGFLGVTNYVTGTSEVVPVTCRAARMIGDCGVQAKYFEPKQSVGFV